MTDLLEGAIKRAELALHDLKRVRANPKDETALVMACGELECALRETRQLFPLLGFESIEARVDELSAAETRGDLERLLASNAGRPEPGEFEKQEA